MNHWQYNPYVLPLIITAAISAALAFAAWRRRPAPSATALAWLMLAVTEWSLGYALELGSADLATEVFWAKVEYLGIVIVPVTWLALALQYTGRERWLTRRNVALLAIVPLLTLMLVWTNDLHGLIWSNIRQDTSGSFLVLDLTYGAGFWVNFAYSYLLIMLGTVLFLQALVRSPYLYRGQAGALLIGALAPWVGNALYISGLSPFPHLDLTPLAFTLTGLMMLWGLLRFRLLDIVPVARDAVIEGMSDGVIVLDAQNRIVDLNPAAQRIIGCPASEAIGQPAAQILSAQADLLEHYRDVTEAHEEIVLGEGEAQRTYDLGISSLYDRRGRLTGRLVVLRDIAERKRAEEALRRAHDELERRVQERTADLAKANEALQAEITERKRAEEELKESLEKIERGRQEWESTADSLPDLVCLADDRGRIIRANRIVETWNLARVVDVKGREFHELLHPGCAGSSCYLDSFWEGAWEGAIRGEPTECEAYDEVLKRHVLVRVQPWKDWGKERVLGSTVIVVRDITERKQAEEALKEYSERLEEMVDERTKELRDAQERLLRTERLAAIGQLGASMCHELRNPLGVINNSVYYLNMKLGDVDEKAKKHLKIMDREIARSSKIVSDLLSLTEGKKPTVQKTRTNTIVQDALSRTTVPHTVAVITELGEGLPPLMADPDQIEQVFINLALNAVQAMTPPESLSRAVETPNGGELKISTREKEGFIEIEFKDNGCGIPEENLGKLFEPLFTTKTKGIGLGLAISKRIIEAHSGSIAVESELGVGTTFRVRLPISIN